jgi:predicted dehydrogenase
MLSRKLKMGMVGGGHGAFIGAVHRMAAQLDGLIELSCGAFSSDPSRTRASGRDLFLPPERVYGSYTELFEKEAALPEGERMDFVAIVTPNDLHFPVARAALEAGFPVVCDKPMTHDLQQAKELQRLVRESGLLFALTHNYTGYAMVKEAREIVRGGRLGAVRKVIVEYPQGWLATALEASGQKQASWRTDPARAGAFGCMGDIGTHAENLAEYITGLRITELCADLTTFVKGRALDDDGNVLLHFENGARGVLHASQVSIDEENALSIRVHGERGGLEWRQEEPNTLILKWSDQPRQVLRPGHSYLSPTAHANLRLPAGHPEGFIEAFANIYRNFALALSAMLSGTQPAPEHLDFPNVDDGLRGMQFLDALRRSVSSDTKWTSFEG